MLISVLTGFAAGAVHVVGGADHLVAMAPFSLRRPLQAVKSGMAWGGGHSLGVVLLGIVAIFFKDLIHVESMSAWAEFLVGVSLLVIGALAIHSKNPGGANLYVGHPDALVQHGGGRRSMPIRAL